MRRFCSYGPIDTELHYYAPREALIEKTLLQLMGEHPEREGHYITVWAPRQTGKTWIMRQVARRIATEYSDRFAVLEFSLGVLRGWRYKPPEHQERLTIPDALKETFQEYMPGHPQVDDWEDFRALFSVKEGLWDKPLIMLIDEIDTLPTPLLNVLTGQFREMYLQRTRNRLHGLALIGVRAVLGIESDSGSPFNVQRSVRIPNLTADEVRFMYHWYERESGQKVAEAVIDRVYHETRGQPGLVSWLGELLTEEFNPGPDKPLTMETFERAYRAAIHILPNNNILNIIGKARRQEYRGKVLELFRTRGKTTFSYDNPSLNYLYLNGVIDWELGEDGQYYVRFASPFVQKRLFNYFAGETFPDPGALYDPFEDLSNIIGEKDLNVPNLLRRYEKYFHENRSWLLENVPRRTDMRPYEAVYHFSLYRYLADFLQPRRGQVIPEFPTGNGKLDLLLRYGGRTYGVEVKSYVDAYEYRLALRQAARYGKSLGLNEMTLALFVETIDETNRARYEVPYTDEETAVVVQPVFIATG